MIFAILIASLHLALGCWIFGRLPRAPRTSSVSATPSVSIVIPARNEEHNLPKLLDSIFSQKVLPVEVLVIDDHSTDRTAQVASEHGATVVAAESLPEGWRGKPWACQQGANRAKADLLLFLDADTWLEPGGLARLLMCHQGGATSAGPWHDIDRGYENLSLFFNLLMAAGACPQSLFGQVLLIDSAAYQRVGGHEAVKGRVLENVWLAPRLRAHGVPVRSFLGKGIVSFRMYPDGLQSLVQGWAKGFASGAGATPPVRMFAIIIWLSILLAPLIALATGIGPAVPLLIYLSGTAQIAAFGRLVGRFHWHSALLYPLPLVFFFWIFSRSALRRGRPVAWKGRQVHVA